MLDNVTRDNCIVDIRSLNHFFGSKTLKSQILFDINFSIYSREIVIMTGPSGSGKTTLLTLIGGLRSVQQGSLKFLGQELKGASNQELVHIRRHIGYIFQAHNLLDFLTARQNVQMSMELHKDISEKEACSQSEAMLAAVKLSNRVDYYPSDLSGGQKQRVAIARALVSRPKLVLADEPTAALDSKTGRDVVNLMQQLAYEQHCSILMVTHDNRILDIADRIIHMEDGRLTQQVS
ncbi:MAG TPA: DevA family ABC transporter ATP-binding protein [Trichormus sp. M33_DOE_039]|nr:DevA family ABC transporter ATP-binding protein [Trichormus sp. M33_DOE_039]